MKIHNNEQINKIEIESKDTEPRVIQPVENIKTKHNERPLLSKTIKSIYKEELHKQM